MSNSLMNIKANSIQAFIGYGQNSQTPLKSCEDSVLPELNESVKINTIESDDENLCFDKISRTKKRNSQKLPQHNVSFCEYDICDKDDPHYQFIIGKNCIEGTGNFRKNVKLGVKYLEKSISNELIDAVIYYCEMIERGDVIPRDFQKAKKCLSSFLKKNDGRIFSVYEKISEKREKIL